MKKVPVVFAFLIVAFSGFVSAGPVEGLRQLTDGLRGVIVVLIQFISGTIFDINSFNEFLFAKILLFSMILLIVYTVIKKNSIFGGIGNKPIQWIISASVSILAIRYLSDDFIRAILLQYGALAVGLTVFLPWAIYFFFLHQSGIGPFGRRLGWIVFATAFFALWSFRHNDIGNASSIYWVAIGFVAVSMMFDKSIHKYFGMSGFRKIHGRINKRIEWDIEDRIAKLGTMLKDGIIKPDDYRIEISDLKKRLNELNK